MLNFSAAGAARRYSSTLQETFVAFCSYYTWQESLEKPFEREVLILTKKSGVDIMKAFKKDGKMVKASGSMIKLSFCCSAFPQM